MSLPSLLTVKNTYSCSASVDRVEKRRTYLGQDNDFLARYLMMLQRLPKETFRLSVGVGVCGVEGVDTIVETAWYDTSQFWWTHPEDKRRTRI